MSNNMKKKIILMWLVCATVFAKAQNVGIGTLTPIQTLDVNGRMNISGGVIQRGGAAITTTSDLGLYSRIPGNYLRFVTNAGPILFFSDDNIGTNANLTIEANGNVGIGTVPGARLHIKHNSYPTPSLLIEETESDYTRMEFRNTSVNSFWQMNASPQKTGADARLEFWNISDGAPSTPLVLTGDGKMIITGPFAPSNNTGIAGQVLQSNGNAAPSWVSPTHSSYNNMIHLDQPYSVEVTGTDTFDLPGLSYTFTLASNARISTSFYINLFGHTCFACGTSLSEIFINVDGSRRYFFFGSVNNGGVGGYGANTILNLEPGTHTVKLQITRNAGADFVAGGGGGWSSVMDLVIVKE
jgi:hypothetical protein